MAPGCPGKNTARDVLALGMTRCGAEPRAGWPNGKSGLKGAPIGVPYVSYHGDSNMKQRHRGFRASDADTVQHVDN